MRASFIPPIAAWLRASSGVTVAAGLLMHGAASAQTAVPAPSVDEKKAAEIVDPSRPGAAEERAGDKGEIIVTGSRIQRAGFNAPTPTTVLGDIELREGNPVSIGQVLNDSPQFRSTVTPATTTGNTNNSAEQADLRGLGTVRTLTLLNGHRFVGSFDLNTIPKNIVKRVDIVTGSASAAYGSGAVAVSSTSSSMISSRALRSAPTRAFRREVMGNAIISTGRSARRSRVGVATS